MHNYRIIFYEKASDDKQDLLVRREAFLLLKKGGEEA